MQLSKRNKPAQNKSYVVIFTLLLLLTSTLIYLVNLCCYHYPGNNYFPPNTWGIGLCLFFIFLGSRIQFGHENRMTTISLALIALFVVMASIAWATNAIQYTPFTPIDSTLIALENYLHINLFVMVTWTNKHPFFKQLLESIYNSLPLQMTFFPLLVIIMEKYELLAHYLTGLLATALIGFTVYYFFPTTAPSSMMQAHLFNASQLATGIKFYQIHHYINPTTLEGGMIAFPSFHVIWAWYSLYLLKDWRPLFFIMMPINFLLMLSCFLLGWHYVLDVVASLVLIVVLHLLFKSGDLPYKQRSQAAFSHFNKNKPY